MLRSAAHSHPGSGAVVVAAETAAASLLLLLPPPTRCLVHHHLSVAVARAMAGLNRIATSPLLDPCTQPGLIP